MSQKSKGEEAFANAWRVWISDRPGDQPAREYHFSRERNWRFDFAFPETKVAVEIDGGSWSGGRHNRGSGFAKDCEKFNAAAADGWRVFRFTTQMVTKNARAAVEMVDAARRSQL